MYHTLMTSYLIINIVWPEFAELLATRPIAIHEFHSTGIDCMKKMFFWVNLNFIMLFHKSTLYSCFPAV